MTSDLGTTVRNHWASWKPPGQQAQTVASATQQAQHQEDQEAPVQLPQAKLIIEPAQAPSVTSQAQQTPSQQAPGLQHATVQTVPPLAGNYNVEVIESALIRIAAALEKVAATTAACGAVLTPQPRQPIPHAALTIHNQQAAPVDIPVQAPAMVPKPVQVEVPEPTDNYHDEDTIEILHDNVDVHVEEEDVSRRCGVCHMVCPVDGMFIIDPCGHYPYCEDCKETLCNTFAQLPAYLRMSTGTESKLRCPHCQQAATGAVKYYQSQKN